MDVAEKTRKAPGRPRKTPENRKRNIQVVRVRDALRARLASAAELRQRSISEEMEARLEQSFSLEDEFGELARFVGLAVKATEARIGRAWFTDETSRRQTRAAVDAVLDVIVAKSPSFDSLKEIADVAEILKTQCESGTVLPSSIDDLESLVTKFETILDLVPAQIDALKATRFLNSDARSRSIPTPQR